MGDSIAKILTEAEDWLNVSFNFLRSRVSMSGLSLIRECYSNAHAPNSRVARWRCPQEKIASVLGAVSSGRRTVSPVTGQLALGTISIRSGFLRNRRVVPAQFRQSNAYPSAALSVTSTSRAQPPQ